MSHVSDDYDQTAVDGHSSDAPWYRQSTEDITQQLNTTTDGLSSEEAEQRLKQYGANRIGRRRRVSAWQVALHQFQSPLIYVLLGALVVTVTTSLITAETRWSDAIVIGLVLIVNGTVGFIQEYRAENAVDALMKMVAPKATVRRDEREQQINADMIVPGDVVMLDEGHVVPADLRLFHCSSLQVDEAALTGESVPVQKTDHVMSDADENLPPGDQSNMAFMGTAVTSGRAEGLVVATAKHTELGQIAQQVEEAGEVETPLQKRIQRLAILITWGILVIAAVAMLVGLFMGRDWARMITLAVALAVAAIPAGLPIVVTVALAIGVRRMARRHAVIRHLPAVDTLGSCTTIVSDKTGTLTQNRMTVRAILAGDDRYDVTNDARSPHGRIELHDDRVIPSERRALYETLLAGVLCNDATMPEQAGQHHDADGERENEPEERSDNHSQADQPSGDPMEIALLFAGLKADMVRSDLEQRFPLIDEIPFNTENRFMAVIRQYHEEGGEHASSQPGPMVLVKGAPETVAEMCDRRRLDDGSETSLDHDQMIRHSESFAADGLRVLAMAVGYGHEAADAIRNDEPRGLTFVGMQGLLDPPRDSAVQAVDDCHGAGIRVIMVTGDHARTAASIAREVHVDRPARALLVERRHDTHPSPSIQESDTATRGAEHSDELPETHTGQDIADFSDDQLDDVLASANVFARVKPIQKTRIVDRLKARDEIVAVTGDGVNDAPALKTAHLGAAMGSGTDVAKEASDMVITDDNFASVYSAVEEGRTAFRNIRMATFFLLSTGAADVLIILSALALGWPLPLLPAQILWCNVVTNGIADVALAFEPGEKALYRRPPRPPSEGVLDAMLLERLVIVGIWLAVGVLAVFLWQWGFDWESWSGNDDKLTLARTAALTTLVLFQKVHVFNCRSEDVSIFKKSLFANKLLFLGVLASLAVHIAAVYIPLTQNLLSLAPLDPMTWVIATGVALTAIIVNDLHKRLRPRYQQEIDSSQAAKPETQ